MAEYITAKNIYEQFIEQGFGMLNLGRHRGLYYAPRDHMQNCPRGWCFVAVEDNLTEDKLRDIANEFRDMEG